MRAVTLATADLHNYLIIESGDGLGGTWYCDTYPVVAVDIPSFPICFHSRRA
jgi:cyclohexanone monooxygenase